MGKDRVERGRGKRSGVVKKTKRQTRATRAFYIAIIVVAVGGLAALTYISTRPNDTSASQYDPSIPPVKSNGYVSGSANAPIEIIEYADFECPTCGQFAAVIEPDIRTNFVNSGKVRWRFIDYPLPMHRNTWNASRAAACADQQGKFWEMHDMIFQNQDRWNGEATHRPDGMFKDYAKQLGLNTSQFNQCVDDKQTQAKIQAHMKLAEDAHVQATPTFVIGGKSYPGMQTYDEMKKLIDDAIAAAPAPKPAGGSSTAAPKR